METKRFTITVEADWLSTHNEIAERELRPQLDKIFGPSEYNLSIDDLEALSWLLEEETPTLESPREQPDLGTRKEDSVACRARRYSQEQVIAILKEAAASVRAQEDAVARRHGLSPTTFRRWKARYTGAEASQAPGLKQLQEEASLLKRIVAEQAMEIRTLKDRRGDS